MGVRALRSFSDHPAATGEERVWGQGDSDEATARPGWEAGRTEMGVGPEGQEEGAGGRSPGLEVGGRSGRSPHSASLFGRRTRRLPPPPAFLLLGGPRRWPGPGSLQKADSPPCTAPGRSDNGPGGLATAQLPASPLRPLPARRGEGGAGARGLLAQPAPSSSLVHVRFLKGGSVWPEDKGATVTDGRGEGKILIIVFGLVKPVEGPFRGDKSLHLSSPSHVITPVTGGTPLPLGLLDSARPEGEGRGR